MDISRKDVRLLLLHEFRLGHKATEATRNICTTMGEGVLSYDTAKRWSILLKLSYRKCSNKPRGAIFSLSLTGGGPIGEGALLEGGGLLEDLR